MQISIEEVRELMLAALRIRGVSGEKAEFIVSDYLEAQLEGKGTMGSENFFSSTQCWQNVRASLES